MYLSSTSGNLLLSMAGGAAAVAAARTNILKKKIRKVMERTIHQNYCVHVTFKDITKIYSHATFCHAFRMERSISKIMLRMVEKRLYRNQEMGTRSGRPVIATDMCSIVERS